MSQLRIEILALAWALVAAPAAAQLQPGWPKPPKFRVVALSERAGGDHQKFVDAAKLYLNQLAADNGFAIDYITGTERINDEFLEQYQLFIQLNYPPYHWAPIAKKAFVDAIHGGTNVRMVYGRLNVARSDLFSEALLVLLRPGETPATGLPPIETHGALTTLSRELYRAQVGSETAKRARWLAESVVMPGVITGMATRNRLMGEPVSNLASSDRRRTDILHEYFVAPDRFNDFIAACRDIIPKARAEFLNVTLRYVMKDETSALSFATTDRIAAVMSFSQDISPDGEADMLRMTEALIERVVDIGGAYYLPYRLHARQDQFERAYKNFARVAERKRHYDPNLVFRNGLWDNYFAAV